MARTFETPSLARAQRSTRYTLARQLRTARFGVGVKETPLPEGTHYTVMDTVLTALDVPFMQGLTFHNGL